MMKYKNILNGMGDCVPHNSHRYTYQYNGAQYSCMICNVQDQRSRSIIFCENTDWKEWKNIGKIANMMMGLLHMRAAVEKALRLHLAVKSEFHLGGQKVG